MTSTANRIGFYALLLIVSGLMLWIAVPYLQPFIMALVVAIVTSPLYDRVLRITKRPGLSSVVSVIAVLLVAVIPLFVFIALAIAQFTALAPQVQSFLATHSFESIAGQLPLLSVIMPGLDISGLLQSAAGSTVEFLKQLLVPFATTTLSTAVNVVLFVFMLLFMYPAKDRFIAYVKTLMPLERHEADDFVDSLVVAANTTISSSLAAALVQAFLSFLAYLVLGVPAPLFLLFAAFLTSLLPFGSGLVNIPLVIALFATGHPIPAIALFFWQIIIVANADNLVRMEMLKRSTVKLPELLTLLATLGGLVTFGFLGIIYGPLIAVMFVFVLELWRKGR